MKSKATKVFLFLLLPMALLLMLNGVSAGQESKPAKDSPPAEEKPTSEQSLADLAPLASKLAERFIDLEKDIEAGIDLSAAKESLGEIIRSQDDIHSTVEKLKTSKKYGVARLEKLKGAIQSQEDSVKRLTESLNEAVSQLGVSLKSWSEDKEKWSEFRSSLPKDVLLSTVKPAFSKANQSIEPALNLINRRMKPLLAVQQEAGEIQTRFHKLEAEVEALLLATRGSGSPVMRRVVTTTTPTGSPCTKLSQQTSRLRGHRRIRTSHGQVPASATLLTVALIPVRPGTQARSTRSLTSQTLQHGTSLS